MGAPFDGNCELAGDVAFCPTVDVEIGFPLDNATTFVTGAKQTESARRKPSCLFSLRSGAYLPD